MWYLLGSVCVCVCVCAQSYLTLCDPTDSPDSSVLEFSRQEYWSGLPCPPPGDLPHPGRHIYISCVSCIGRQILYHYATWKAQVICVLQENYFPPFPLTLQFADQETSAELSCLPQVHALRSWFVGYLGWDKKQSVKIYNILPSTLYVLSKFYLLAWMMDEARIRFLWS